MMPQSSRRSRLIMRLAMLALIALATALYPSISARLYFKVEDSEPAMRQAIEQMTNENIHIQRVAQLDNRRFALFTTGDAMGSAAFTQGPNGKLKLDSTSGVGSGAIPYQIVTTNKGQYIMYAGNHTDELHRFILFVEDERYEMILPEEPYVIMFEPLIRETELTYPTAAISFDQDGNETGRINLPSSYVLTE